MVSILLSRVKDSSEASGSNLYTYTIKNFTNLVINVRTPISPMPLPEDSAKENVLVKIEGNTKTVDISFTIAESTVDLGGGVKRTSVSEIKTVAQQVDYLSNQMQGQSLQHRFTLTIKYSEVGGTDQVFHGFINDINFTATDSTPITFNTSISFIEGKVITTLDGDVPSKPSPTSLVAPTAGGGAGRLTASWNAPSYKGGSNIIDTYDLEFMDTTTNAIKYKKYGQATSPFTTPTNSLTPSARYSFRVRGISVEGDGAWSAWYPIIDEIATTPDGVVASAT
jgi:hypothetical protein